MRYERMFLMTKYNRYFVPSFLILSCGLLGVLIPGGPIETRNFSHISPVILGAFNTFLTLLGIASIMIIYFIFKHKAWAFLASLVCGVSYFLVYVLDLWNIFPVSSDPMPNALYIIEMLGLIASIPLMIFSVQGMICRTTNNQDLKNELYSKKIIFVVLLLMLVGVGIIIFATKSAMRN